MSSTSITARLFASSVFGLAGAASATAATISVNFVGGQNGDGTGNGSATVTGASVGAVPVGSWNNEAPASLATAAALNDSSGNPSGASITYTSPNTWAATGAPGGGGNADMMNGYLDNLQNGGSISVTGLPAAFTSNGYEVLVYQNTDSAGSWGYTATDNASHSDTRYGQQLTGGGGNYPLSGTDGFTASTSTNAAGPGTAANYVILSGLTGSSFTITPDSGSTGDGRVRPNGFQIVSVPEPTIGGLLAFSGAAIGLRRRRSSHGVNARS